MILRKGSTQADSIPVLEVSLGFLSSIFIPMAKPRNHLQTLFWLVEYVNRWLSLPWALTSKHVNLRNRYIWLKPPASFQARKSNLRNQDRTSLFHRPGKLLVKGRNHNQTKKLLLFFPAMRSELLACLESVSCLKLAWVKSLIAFLILKFKLLKRIHKASQELQRKIPSFRKKSFKNSSVLSRERCAEVSEGISRA